MTLKNNQAINKAVADEFHWNEKLNSSYYIVNFVNYESKLSTYNNNISFDDEPHWMDNILPSCIYYQIMIR